MELSLANKVTEGVIDVEDAMAAANRPNILEEYLKTKGGIAAQSQVGAPQPQSQVQPKTSAQPQASKSNFMSWGKK